MIYGSVALPFDKAGVKCEVSAALKRFFSEFALISPLNKFFNYI